MIRLPGQDSLELLLLELVLRDLVVLHHVLLHPPPVPGQDRLRVLVVVSIHLEGLHPLDVVLERQVAGDEVEEVHLGPHVGSASADDVGPLILQTETINL